MCAVCFTSVQVVPVAAIVARAAWVQRRKGGTVGAKGQLSADAPAEQQNAQVPITVS